MRMMSEKKVAASNQDKLKSESTSNEAKLKSEPQQAKASAQPQANAKPQAKPHSRMITNASGSGHHFLAHKHTAAHEHLAAKKSNTSSAHFTYKEEVRGKNCGLAAQGTYVSTTDDAASCKSKCSADKDCLAYTTYNTKCAVKCLHYSHTCDQKHQSVTQCSGVIVSYSKVKEATSPEQSVPQEEPLQTMDKNVTVETSPKVTGAHNKISVDTSSKRDEKTTATKGTIAPKLTNEVAKKVHPVKTAESTKHSSLKRKAEVVAKAKPTATKVVPLKSTATKSHHVSVAKSTVPGIAVPIANVTAADGTALSKVPPASKNGTKKKCACVHRHGKKVCHCVGEVAQRNEMKALNSKELRHPSKFMLYKR